MIYLIYRHINGITINPPEYVLMPNSDKLMEFPSREEASAFLLNHGLEEEKDGVYIEETT